MTGKFKAQTTELTAASSHDEIAMEVLDRIDDLRSLAIATGDQVLADGLAEVFDSFLNRYCDSRHAALDTRLRQNGKPQALIH